MAITGTDVSTMIMRQGMYLNKVADLKSAMSGDHVKVREIVEEESEYSATKLQSFIDDVVTAYGYTQEASLLMPGIVDWDICDIAAFEEPDGLDDAEETFTRGLMYCLLRVLAYMPPEACDTGVSVNVADLKEAVEGMQFQWVLVGRDAFYRSEVLRNALCGVNRDKGNWGYSGSVQFQEPFDVIAEKHSLQHLFGYDSDDPCFGGSFGGSFLEDLGELYELFSGESVTSQIPRRERLRAEDALKEALLRQPSLMWMPHREMAQSAFDAGLIAEDSMEELREAWQKEDELLSEWYQEEMDALDDEERESRVADDALNMEGQRQGDDDLASAFDAWVDGFADKDEFCRQYLSCRQAMCKKDMSLDIYPDRLVAAISAALEERGVGCYTNDDAFNTTYNYLCRAETAFARSRHVGE